MLVYVLAALPALHRSDTPKRWVTDCSRVLNQQPRTLVHPNGAGDWMLAGTRAGFAVVVEGTIQWTRFDGEPMSFLDAMCTSLAVHYLSELSFRARVFWSLTLLGKEVCQLPGPEKKTN